MQNNDYSKRAPAADQAVRILNCLADNSPRKLTLTAICEQVGINKSKGYSLLNTLLHHGLIAKDPDHKTYSLGLKLLFLSRKLLDSLGYRELTSPHLENLAQATQTTALFLVRRDGQAFVAAKQQSNEPVGVNIRTGHVFPDTHGAHGVALAAFLPPGEQEALLQQKELYFLGDPEATAAGMDNVREAIEQCRRQGFAKDHGRMQHGINAVAAPVFDPKGDVFGFVLAIGTYPAGLMDNHGALAAKAAQGITQNLGGPLDRYVSQQERKGI
jgi:IclR family KDG regulon transcriptional repressor